MLKGANLPREILVNIFSRLPAKSLCRFKCVSKNPFRNLISDPHFTQKQLNRHKHQERVVVTSQYSLYSLDFGELFDAEAIATKLDFPSLKQPTNSCVTFWGSCNGLILVVYKYLDINLFLVNPTTRELKKISVSPFALNPSISYTAYGLGYDSYTDDYKIVALNYYREENCGDSDHDIHYPKEPNCTVVSVFSLKRRYWRKIQDSPYNHPSVEKPSPGVFVNGYLHWIATSKSDDLSVIVAFNVADETFGEVSPPPYSVDNQYTPSNDLGVLGGCLCMIKPTAMFQTDVWVMKEYSLTESWTRFLITTNDHYNIQIEPICLSKDGEFLLDVGGWKLVVCNLKERERNDLVIHGIPNDEFVRYVLIKTAITYVESVVSPHYSNGNAAKYRALGQVLNTYRICSGHKRRRPNSHFLGGNASGSSWCEGRGGVSTTDQSDDAKMKLRDAIVCLGDLKDVDGNAYAKAFNKLCDDPI